MIGSEPLITMPTVERMFFSLLFGCLIIACHAGEQLQNGDFESMVGWHCYNIHCELSSSHHCGSHSLKVSGRSHTYEGPISAFNASANHYYSVQAYVKLLHDIQGQLGQNIDLVIDFSHTDGTHRYVGVAWHPLARTSDGWVHLQGSFQVPDHPHKEIRLKIQGPDPSVNFLVDCASITNIWLGNGWRAVSDRTIHDIRQSNINLQITVSDNIDRNNVEIQVLQKKKAFPLGTAVNAWSYLTPDYHLYRDFIHTHFTWAVHEASMKWQHVEPRQGEYHFDKPLRVLQGLKSHGLKMRGHNLIWSVDSFVMDWVKRLSGDALKSAVEHHIVQTMNMTKGGLEHWDVNNENLHGQWYQERLHDFSYELTPFRIAHNADPNVKLFLNDFGIVNNGASTEAYVAQAQRLKEGNVGLYGLGVQCHFGDETAPDPYLIKDRLDRLAKTGLPVWVTEFNVLAKDENTRADFVETAMRAFFGHPAVEGILLWGFWDKAHSRGPHAALAKGDTMQLTAAGRRFLDLWERQWMTDETHMLAQSGSRYTVRGFHGDYEVHVRHQGKDLTNLMQTFILGESPHAINISINL